MPTPPQDRRCPFPRQTPGPDIGAVARLAPAKAGDIAFDMFCRPELSRHRAANHSLLTERARFHLRNATWKQVPTPAGPVQTYTFEPDGAYRGTVLLVHGWTSEAAFMTAFVEPLKRSGFRTIVFDFPAHGRSPGRRTNLAECARAMLSVCEAFGPIDAVVSHSFGGFVSLLVAEGGPPMPRAHPIGRFVLISCPNRLSDITSEFSRHLGLTPSAQRAYEHHLERVGHRPVRTFSVADLLRTVDRPAVLLHGGNDAEVPIDNAQAIADACPSARLHRFDGLGHRTILYAPPVMRTVMKVLTADQDVARAEHKYADASAGL